MKLRTVFAASLLTLASSAWADDAPPPAGSTPLDLGVLRNSDIRIVQKQIYQKAGRLECGAFVGWMPFDTFTTTPVAGLQGRMHLSESFAAELSVTGGYSLKNANFKLLEGPAYGITPDAYRFMTSVVADAQWSPIYGKMNWRGKKIVHYDTYGLAGAGLSVEQSMLPDQSMAFPPTVAVGAGMRFFLSQKSALRVQIRDDVLFEKRTKTEDSQAMFIKQNVALTVGYSMLGSKK